MLKSVPYLAALLPAVLLICLSAHADTQVNTIEAIPNVSVLSDAAAKFSCTSKAGRLDKSSAVWHETC